MPETGNLSEEQILDLLTAKRRVQRLRSLQRVSDAARQEAAARQQPAESDASADDIFWRSDARAAAPRSVSDAEAAPLADSQAGTRPDGRPRAAGSLPAVRIEPLARTPGGGLARKWLAGLRGLPWGVVRDRGLLLVEVAALIALIVVVAGQFTSLADLNAEVAESQRPPVAAAATADEELPGSSTPPPSASEIPGPVKSLVRSATPLPIPTPGPQAATRIVIPAIGVDSVVVEGDSWEMLKKGVGHHVGSANPGERGNAVFSGHDDVYGEVFRRLEELKAGDVVTLYAGTRQLHYKVKRTRIVEPKEISVMSATPDATLTLITCYPYRIDTQRFIVIATLSE